MWLYSQSTRSCLGLPAAVISASHLCVLASFAKRKTTVDIILPLTRSLVLRKHNPWFIPSSSLRNSPGEKKKNQSQDQKDEKLTLFKQNWQYFNWNASCRRDPFSMRRRILGPHHLYSLHLFRWPSMLRLCEANDSGLATALGHMLNRAFLLLCNINTASVLRVFFSLSSEQPMHKARSKPRLYKVNILRGMDERIASALKCSFRTATYLQLSNGFMNHWVDPDGGVGITYSSN
jgi:hypothetical protein